MPAAEDITLKTVLDYYGVDVRGIKNETLKEKKAVWWIMTENGRKLLKRVSGSEETLRYILDAMKHLSSNGVNLPGILKTKEGKEYVCLDGTCYVLMEAVEGKSPSYNSPGELAAIVKSLAKFHKASGGFIPAPDTKPKSHLGKWVEDYTSQLEDLKRFVNDDDFRRRETMIVKEFPYFESIALRSIEGLKGKEYQDWVKRVETEKCLCHQDYAAGNLVLTPAGEIFVLDMDSVTIDIPARDIRKLLNKIMKKQGKWDLDKTRSILEIYQSVNPLTRSDWKVVMLDLMYPHLFFGAVNKYCYRRDKEWTTEKYHIRIAEMAAFSKTFQAVYDNFDSLIPVQK